MPLRPSDRVVEVDAPAKVNLLLRVLARRPDGFHDLETLFQAISMADRVTVSIPDSGSDDEAAGDARRPETRAAPGPIELSVDGPDLGPIESNLAYRAARSFQKLSGLRVPVRIGLTKRIPAGAGLGGGSSDAAAVLKCMAELTGFEDRQELLGVAAELGSDVPFFLSRSPLAFGTGRGERLTEIDPLPGASLVVALPDVHVGTADAYRKLAAGRGSIVSDSRSARASGPDLGDGAPTSWSDVAAVAANDFESVLAAEHPEIRESLEGLRARGATVTLLSGSGAASFGLFERHEDAHEAAASLNSRHPWRYVVVETLTAMPEPSTP